MASSIHHNFFCTIHFNRLHLIFVTFNIKLAIDKKRARIKRGRRPAGRQPITVFGTVISYRFGNWLRVDLHEYYKLDIIIAIYLLSSTPPHVMAFKSQLPLFVTPPPQQNLEVLLPRRSGDVCLEWRICAH